MKKTLMRAFVLVLACVACLMSCRADETAAITGLVTDPAGRSVPAAKVAIINMSTNVEVDTATNDQGIYRVVALQPGIYRITVLKDGFKSVVKNGVEIHVQDVASINFELELGSVSETVTVSSGGLVIDTTDGTVSTTIDRNFAENLPLNGRSFQTLISLAPGVVIVPTGGTGNQGTFSVNGQRANSNDFTVDGVSADLGGFTTAAQAETALNGNGPALTELGTTQGMVAVDSLQEFKIQTSTYAPEFGRQPGGQISLLTRSGTSEFHGTAFDYFRNTVLDANNWFNGYINNPPLPKGAEHQNDFGGTFGGPLSNHGTFFFISYEGLRLLVPSSGQTIVPDSCLRGMGDCLQGESPAAAAFQPILKTWPIGGPEITTPCTTMNNPMCPPTGQESTGTAPYTEQFSSPSNLDAFAIKIDQSVGSRVHLFGRYAHTTSGTTAIGNGGPNLEAIQNLGENIFTLGADANIQANLTNEFRFNYTANVSTNVNDFYYSGGATPLNPSIFYPAPFAPQSTGILFNVYLPSAAWAIPLGTSGTNTARQINIIDNVTDSLGKHEVKWGFDYRRLFPTAQGNSPNHLSYFVFSSNDLDSGTVSSLYDTRNLILNPIFTNFSAYWQDTWKVASHFTLTYGLRWELNPVPSEQNGFYPPNAIGLNNPPTATYVPFGTTPPFKTTLDNFAPRIGLAYQIRSAHGRETVLRGGFGVFYDFNSETFANDLTNVSNFQVFSGVPFPAAANSLPALSFPPPPSSGPYCCVNAIDPSLKLPYTLEWNIALEQALGSEQSFSLSYVGAAGYRLLRNNSLFNFSPNFYGINYLDNGSSSNYEALQLQFNRRLSRGLQALGSFTYSHSIDDASSAQEVNLSTSSTGTVLLNPILDRGNSDFDLRYALSGAFSYALPTPGTNPVSKAVFGGWATDLFAIAHTGLPVDLIGGTYFVTSNFYELQLRPNLIPGVPRYLYGAQCAAAHGNVPCPGGMVFNPAAFAPVPTDANGNPVFEPGYLNGTLGRNVMRGSGAWQLDFALHKQFNVTDKINLQFRGEFFNLFNHPNFGSVNNTLGEANFGEATQTLNNALGGLNSLYQIGGPRSIQLALKLQF